MSEETGQEAAPIKQAEISTVEDQAREQGWVPKDDFQGEEHKWVEAGEFIRRGELFKKIDSVGRENKQIRQTLEQFKSHYARVKETEYQHALTTLKAERKTALVDGDFEQVERIENQIDEVKAQAVQTKAEITATTQVPDVPPEVTNWVEKNEWYSKDLPMKAFADQIAVQLNKQGYTGTALLKGVDVEIRKAFPNKFTNPNRERVGSVEGTSSRGATRGSGFELTEQEARIMNGFVRDGVMTKEQYITDLKKVKGIK